ncbi:hypothetical protein EON67_00905 [archaeon]|nr:MAG: hypothetical protein EON67_00905 [archaeon]
MRPQRRIPAWVRVGAGVVAFLCVMTLLSFIPRGGSATPREGAASGGLYPIRAHTLSARAQAGGGGVAARPAHIPASRQPEAAPPRAPHERPACDAWECTRPLQGGGVDEPVTDKPPAVAQTNTQAGEGDAVERGQSSRSGDCTASDANLFVCGRAARDAQNSLDTSSMTTWIQGGGRLPILLIAGKRADMVKKTLDALLKVRGVQARDVAVLQDGTDAGVESVVKAAGVFLHQHRDNTAAPGDHSVAIAMHFKYSIQYAFSSFAPAAPGLIIVEDDFLFSDDFYEYFHAVAPVLEADKTLWLASAWVRCA